VTKFGIFLQPTRKLSAVPPNAAEYCNSEKKLVKHRWLLYNVCHVWWTLAYKPLRFTPHKILYHSSEIVKRQSKQQKSPLVYQSSHVYTKSAEYTKPRKRHYLAKPASHVPGQWPQPVASGQGWLYVSTWTSMRLVPVRCRVLLHSLLPTDDACSSSSLSTTVIKFSIFSDHALANFLLSRPNSVEYGNSETTTLLRSAKCRPTRPLFQGRTGCGGRPSGWHDIVTCQRLVIIWIMQVEYFL